MQRHHVVMVPGFGGFNVLGSLHYYSGVTRILTGTQGMHQGDSGAPRAPSQIDVHYFPNLPTASIETRAAWLGEWLAKRVERGLFKAGDSLHLVGHSTGGLDIRLLVYNLHYPRLSSPTLSYGAAQQLKQMLGSVQCLSTPHRGTNLSSKLWHLRPLMAAGALGAYAKLKFTPRGCSACWARAIRHLPFLWRHANWNMAFVDSLSLIYSQCGHYESAKARKRYFTMLDWLANIGFDSMAVKDLHPLGRAPFGHTITTPARWSPEMLEREDIIYTTGTPNEVRRRSIITCGARPDSFRCNTYSLLHHILAWRPPSSLGGEIEVPPLLGNVPKLTLGRSMNDGIVNSASMVWPTGNDAQQHNFYVPADHGDIIGHYSEDAADFKYDLLVSETGFSTEEFHKTWRNIREYILTATKRFQL